MSSLKDKIDARLKENNSSRYKLSRLIGCSESTLSKMARGEKPFSRKIKDKILPILEIGQEEFEGWILADKYSKDILEQAIQLKKEKSPEDSRLILTIELDKILKSRDLSRTGLSKLINYSQGGLNEMIIGKEPMSKGVILKILLALELSENEIRSWIIADKYSLVILKEAITALYL